MTNEHERLSEAELAECKPRFERNLRVIPESFIGYQDAQIFMRLLAEVEASRPIVAKHFADKAEVLRLQIGVRRDAYMMKTGHEPPADWRPFDD